MRTLTSLAAALLLIGVLAGCDDGKNPTSGSGANPLVGRWAFSSATMNSQPITLSEMGMKSIILTFGADGTYTATVVDTSDVTDTDTGTWVASGGNLILTDSEGNAETMPYTISGTTLTFSVTISDGTQTITMVQNYTRQ